MKLGKVGVWTSALQTMPAQEARAAVRELERLGYAAVWFPEGVGGKDALTQAAQLLSWGDRIAVGSGIANIYARDPMAMANGARALWEEHPHRFVLGLGVSHAPSVEARGSAYGKPVATMAAYLDAMEAAPYRGVRAETEPVVLAALGPRMLRLAAERTRGAHPYFVPVEHTRFARETLGAHALLAPEQAVLLETDPAKARRAAREHTRYYLGLPNYTNNLLRLGFSPEDLENGGSDALVDAIVAWGGPEAIRARVQAHLDAGANHVCIQAVGPAPGGLDLDTLGELAPVLLDL